MGIGRESSASRYLQDGMEYVQGWLYPTSASIIARLSENQIEKGISGDVGEIGVHHGKLFILLANLAVDGERAYAVDIFDDQHKNVDSSGKGDRAIFERNVSVHAPNARYQIFQESSLDLWGTAFEELKFRLFSIDGGHTTDITCNDLRIVEKVLIDGGIVILDDILNPGWPGVISGLFKYLSNGGGLIPFATSSNKLYLTTDPESAKQYRAMLHTSFSAAILAVDMELAGYQIDIYQEHELYDAGRVSRLRRENAALKLEVDAIHGAKNAFADRVYQLTERAQISPEALQVAEHRASSAEAQLQSAVAQLQEARRQLSDVHVSTSWKITAPIRALKRLVSG